MSRCAERMFWLGLALSFLLNLLDSQPLLAEAPKLEFSEKEFFFGYIPADVVARHDYWLRNTGDAPLAITEVKPTCSCTEFELARPTVPPGDSVRLAVFFSAERMFNRVVKMLIVTSNDPDKSVDTIVFAALVNREHDLVKVEPQQLVFDAIDLANPESAKTFMVRNGSDETVELSLAGDPPEGFEVLISRSRIRPGAEAKVDVRLVKPPEKPGLLRTSLTLRFVLEDAYRVTVPITAQLGQASP
ncbi:MAG: DUF1573 domain-containing protein [bacterium]